MRINFAEHIPVPLDISRWIYKHVIEFIQMVEVRYHSGQMCPKFNLMVAYFLNLLRHFLIETFKLFNISKLLIDIFGFFAFHLDVELYHSLVAIYSELLVDIRPLFGGNFKFVKCSMHVFHYHKIEICEENMNRHRCHEFLQGIFIQLSIKAV